MTRTRYLWIDYVKFIACILVVLGHMFQSFIEPGIMAENHSYTFFIQTIYTFHVPLFFICSGFLYQKYSKIDSFKSYLRHIEKKFISLGIPYILFLTITWVIKRILSDEVNSPVGGLFEAVFVQPIMQYWYLYCLFLLFLIIPTAKSPRVSIAYLFISICLKIISFYYHSEIFAISTVMNNAIWFVGGICLCCFDLPRLFKKRTTPLVSALFLVAFALVSINTYTNWNNMIDFVCGLLACAGFILCFGCYSENRHNANWIQYVSKYTMPIYLMHTMCAAACRIVLLKLGINNLPIHIAMGLIFSFAIPIFVSSIMFKTNALSWMLGIYHKERDF